MRRRVASLTTLLFLATGVGGQAGWVCETVWDPATGSFVNECYYQEDPPVSEDWEGYKDCISSAEAEDDEAAANECVP